MNRICAYPDCKKDISQLPESHILCTKHQIEFNIFIQDLENWNNEQGDNEIFSEGTTKHEERLVRNDYLFLFLHQNGCDVKELKAYLTEEIGSAGATSSLRLSSNKYVFSKGKRRVISFKEELLFITLARNWVTLKQVSLMNGINAGKLGPFIVENYEVRINLSDARIMRISESEIAVEEYRRKLLESRCGTHSFARFAKHGEISPDSFGEMFSTTNVTVRNWIKRGHVKAVRRKSSLFIKKREIKAFAKKVINSEISTSKAVINRCHEVLAR